MRESEYNFIKLGMNQTDLQIIFSQDSMIQMKNITSSKRHSRGVGKANPELGMKLPLKTKLGEKKQ